MENISKGGRVVKKLNELYEGMEEIPIQGIKINSKEVEPGDLFVCTMGVTSDRHEFVEDAIRHGASAIVASKPIQSKVPVVYVPNTNEELPLLASRFYDEPEKSLQLIAVTGTNGKTTVARMIQDLLGPKSCGSMGTNGIVCEKFEEPIRNTTPDADRLYQYFRKFVDAGCTYLSMETSSEAYYRHRLDHLEFEVGILTNITEDHLNIHQTIENYVACKKKMITQIKKEGTCVLNTDDTYFEECKKMVSCHLVTYGKKEGATLRILSYQLKEQETEIVLQYQGQNYTITSPLVGEFNVYNLCAALLGGLSLGKDWDTLIKRIPMIHVPSGRMQFLHYGQPYHIILDYAHTPDAFLKIYPFLQTIKKGKIITVTGSAGGREKEKRSPMGKIVLENSDNVIFTMDDPREEKVDTIIDDLVSDSKKTNYERIIDRKEAITHALDMAQEKDIVLIAGKGTDNYMALGKEYLPYSDLEVVESYFKK